MDELSALMEKTSIDAPSYQPMEEVRWHMRLSLYDIYIYAGADNHERVQGCRDVRGRDYVIYYSRERKYGQSLYCIIKS
jgi:hypothetical protein